MNSTRTPAFVLRISLASCSNSNLCFARRSGFGHRFLLAAPHQQDKVGLFWEFENPKRRHPGTIIWTGVAHEKVAVTTVARYTTPNRGLTVRRSKP